jgi:hypothetical protein
MGFLSANTTRLSICALLTVLVIAALVRLCTIVFPALPQSSDTFDCDDSTLAMYRHFQKLGIDSTPFVGNLDMDGEKYLESDHVWLMVGTGKIQIAYDWGTPRFDRQHYEGYPISLEFLLHAVHQDLLGGDELASADY